MKDRDGPKRKTVVILQVIFSNPVQYRSKGLGKFSASMAGELQVGTLETLVGSCEEGERETFLWSFASKPSTFDDFYSYAIDLFKINRTEITLDSAQKAPPQI